MQMHSKGLSHLIVIPTDINSNVMATSSRFHANVPPLSLSITVQEEYSGRNLYFHPGKATTVTASLNNIEHVPPALHMSSLRFRVVRPEGIIYKEGELNTNLMW